MHYGIAGQGAEARNLVLLINAGSLREAPAQRIVGAPERRKTGRAVQSSAYVTNP